MLTWAELQDVLLDIEVVLDNCLLSYVEDDPLIPVLISNSLLFRQPNLLPGLEHHNWRPQICEGMQSTLRDARIFCGSDGQMNT